MSVPQLCKVLATHAFNALMLPLEFESRNWTSSAYMILTTSASLMNAAKSLVYSRYNTGPISDPCTTVYYVSNGCSSTTAHALLSTFIHNRWQPNQIPKSMDLGIWFVLPSIVNKYLSCLIIYTVVDLATNFETNVCQSRTNHVFRGGDCVGHCQMLLMYLLLSDK